MLHGVFRGLFISYNDGRLIDQTCNTFGRCISVPAALPGMSKALCGRLFPIHLRTTATTATTTAVVNTAAVKLAVVYYTRSVYEVFFVCM